MGFYENMGLKPLINASETYTNLGGSLMRQETAKAMEDAAEGFVDIEKLLDAVCGKAAELTHNDAAFITSGAAGGLILSAAACLCGQNLEKLGSLPDTEGFLKTEILVYEGDFLSLIPYWKLIKLTGAKIVKVKPSVEAMKAAVSGRTAAVFLFPASLYEQGIPSCEETIPELKRTGVTIVVDAAAQLPPASNLWYYTRELGADIAVFSGGKHIKGPQSTGLIVGKKELIKACRMAASPNPGIGRAFKTGKEELAGFITALESFIKCSEEERYQRQEKILLYIEERLRENEDIYTELLPQGRLGTYQPLLHVYLPKDKNGAECNRFTRAYRDAVDVGVYGAEFHKPDNLIFLNAYNLKEQEADKVIGAIEAYLEYGRDD